MFQLKHFNLRSLSFLAEKIIIGLCYQLVNVISLSTSQSDHIKRLLLYWQIVRLQESRQIKPFWNEQISKSRLTRLYLSITAQNKSMESDLLIRIRGLFISICFIYRTKDLWGFAGFVKSLESFKNWLYSSMIQIKPFEVQIRDP